MEKQEREYNEKLLPGKVVLISDIVRQHVSGKLRLTSYQNERTVVEPLKPTQIYVVYDNVFVQELNEAREYSNPEDLEDQYTLALKEADLKGMNLFYTSGSNKLFLKMTKILSCNFIFYSKYPKDRAWANLNLVEAILVKFYEKSNCRYHYIIW